MLISYLFRQYCNSFLLLEHGMHQRSQRVVTNN